MSVANYKSFHKSPIFTAVSYFSFLSINMKASEITKIGNKSTAHSAPSKTFAIKSPNIILLALLEIKS